MKPERLQEIKSYVRESEYPEEKDIWEIANELIIALEAAQAEAKRLDNALDTSMSGYNVQEKKANRKEKRITELNKDNRDLRKQLVEAQAECKRLQNQLEEATKHWAVE